MLLNWIRTSHEPSKVELQLSSKTETFLDYEMLTYS